MFIKRVCCKKVDETYRKYGWMGFLPFGAWDINGSSNAKANQRFSLLTEQQENWQSLLTIKTNRDVVMIVNSCKIGTMYVMLVYRVIKTLLSLDT